MYGKRTFFLIVALVAVPFTLLTSVLSESLDKRRADVVVYSGEEPKTLDPGRNTALEAGRIIDTIFEGLTRIDVKTMTPVPATASHWEISGDKKTYTFHIRPEARWSDGVPVKARDFVYAWRRVLDGEYASIMEFIAGVRQYRNTPPEKRDPLTIAVRATDEKTLEVGLETPCPFFLELTAFMAYLPVRQDALERHGHSWWHAGKIVSNGPMILAEHRFDRRMRLEKNPRYWNPSVCKNDLTEIRFLRSPITALNLYMAGEIDVITTIPTEFIDLIVARPDCRTSAAFATYYYKLNCTRKPFDDARVRLALALAVDREKIATHIMNGQRIPAYTFVPPIKDYPARKRHEFDPERARRLLAEAGYPGGKGFPEIEISYNTSESHRKIAEAVMEMWRQNLAVGGRAVNMEWRTLQKRVRELEYHAARMSWFGDYTDPLTFLELAVSGCENNQTGYANPAYDRLVTAARLEPDFARRVELYSTAEDILMRDAPFIPIMYHQTEFLIKPEIRGLHMNPKDLIYFHELYVERTDSGK